MEHTQEELADCEGLVVRVRGDGQVYSIVLTTGRMHCLSAALALCVRLQALSWITADMFDRSIAKLGAFSQCYDMHTILLLQHCSVSLCCDFIVFCYPSASGVPF